MSRRSRWLQGLAVATLATLACATLVSSWLWSLALDDACRPIERVDLTIEEMVDLKLKVDASEREGSSELVLSGEEASFVLREHLRLPVYLEVHGDEVALRAAVPYDEQCYNVAYRGGLAVEHGIATATPTELVVGELDLAGWLGPSVEVQPGWLEGEARELMKDHVEHVRIEAGQVFVKVDDVRALR